MPMINCPECGVVVSDRMTKCPHCGNKMSMSIRYPDFYEKTSENHGLRNTVTTANRYTINSTSEKENIIKTERKNNTYSPSRKSFKDFCRSLPYVINRILFPYAKIAFVIWTITWLTCFKSFSNDFLYILFGYIFFCGIADLIYYKNKKKYNRYLIKVLEKETKRIEKELIDIDPKYKNIFNSKNAGTNQRVNIANYDSMDGHQFEYFCADILKNNGFKDVEVTQGSGDHGIDILAEKEGITYAIQCKCYSSNIGNAAVQQAHTGKSIYHKDIAVVLTNRYFTAQAKEEAKILGVKLWDRDKLNEMIKK